ncbi:MAG: hypothetical protein BMS9Abin26_0812 [Gammaproteobacteria bacterium]|nr:MAG: hypothetical protein BMS9Abin26_0812 [Gammaproteobacteria bacterium]
MTSTHRLLSGISDKRLLALIAMTILGLILSITLLISLGQTARITKDVNTINKLLHASAAVKIQYGRGSDALDTFMLLGSDETWQKSREEIQRLSQLASELQLLTKDLERAQQDVSKRIYTNISLYAELLPPLKAIRQDSRGVVSGVRESNLTQASHHYEFISAISEIISAYKFARPDMESYQIMFSFQEAKNLWLLALLDFRAHLMLRNPQSLADMRLYLDLFQIKWQKLIDRYDDYNFEIYDALKRADASQSAWIGALDKVLKVHKSKRWRYDLRFLQDKLNPLSKSFLQDLDNFTSDLNNMQEDYSKDLIAIQREGFAWATIVLALGALLALGLLLFYNRLLHEHQKKRASAEEASDMKTAFLSRMSHELRTPLNAILGFGQLINDDTGQPLSASQKDHVDEILKAGYHLLDLINEILDLTAIESGKLRMKIGVVSLNKVVSECITLLTPLANSRNIEVVNKLNKKAGAYLYADQRHLKQVLINLITNAIKYNKDNGLITLDMEDKEGWVRITITDTGEGISKEDQLKLFQPFERLKTSRIVEGTGIGLAVSRGLVENMNGKIGIESASGSGSTFWVSFRRASKIKSDPMNNDNDDDEKTMVEIKTG